ncbi:MAG: zinc ribbon domain-containing protein, partial [Salinibacter sp.]
MQDLSEAAPAGTQRVRADLPTGGASDPGGDKEDGASREGEEAAEQAAVGRQIVFVVGGALFLVLGLFFATQWSNQYEWRGGSSGSSTARSEAGGRSGSASRSSGARRPGGTRKTQGQSTPMDLQTLLDQTADSLTGPVAGQIDSLRTRLQQAS